jgi:hypothetical protein
MPALESILMAQPVHYYAHDASDGNSVPSYAKTACEISIGHALAFPTRYGWSKFLVSAKRDNVTCEACKRALRTNHLTRPVGW